MEKLKHELIAKTHQSRVVTRALIAQERMLSIDFDPLEIRAHFLEARVNQVAAFERYMWILPAPNVQQLTLNLARAFERIVVHAFAEAMAMDVGRVETRGGQDVRIHSCSKREVTTGADSHHTEPAGAGGI